MIPTDRILLFFWVAARVLFVVVLTIWMMSHADARRYRRYQRSEPPRKVEPVEKVWPVPGIRIWYPCWSGTRVIRETSPEWRGSGDDGCWTWVQQ